MKLLSLDVPIIHLSPPPWSTGITWQSECKPWGIGPEIKVRFEKQITPLKTRLSVRSPNQLAWAPHISLLIKPWGPAQTAEAFSFRP